MIRRVVYTRDVALEEHFRVRACFRRPISRRVRAWKEGVRFRVAFRAAWETEPRHRATVSFDSGAGNARNKVGRAGCERDGMRILGTEELNHPVNSLEETQTPVILSALWVSLDGRDSLPMTDKWSREEEREEEGWVESDELTVALGRVNIPGKRLLIRYLVEFFITL